MKFRIRPAIHEKLNSKESKKKLYEYQKVYLPAIREKCDEGLWQFFGYDFFHDGKIKKIEYVSEGVNLKDLMLEIECYNIYRTDSNYSISCRFLCRFKNVEYFSIEHELDYEDSLLEEHELTYGYSEINSLGEIIEASNVKYKKIKKIRSMGEEAKYDKVKKYIESCKQGKEVGSIETEEILEEESDVQEDEYEDNVNFQSLIICAFENETTFSIVFEHLYVSAFEEIAFELIKNDKRYSLPLRLD